ncbi:hypothetical protein H9623_13280 [Oerskovia sp. Sa1BUA8]|uniref:Uncharacterized protein n=1 Tax=Oerskovia douganii TaxID=2762210 RepID=A0A9D5UI14_9CELL|nr:hypothetical protein [Oerskovia douganii]MBE7701267.1 hypothetical protein [Oerskovia douganii]
MALIDAYRKDTGAKTQIPAHWIGHPVLGKPFSKTPRQKAEDQAAQAAPSTPATGDTTKGK